MPKNIQTSEIHYKNVKLLKDLMSPSGRILPRAKTRLSAKQQRMLSRAVKRARHLALLPYTSLFE